MFAYQSDVANVSEIRSPRKQAAVGECPQVARPMIGIALITSHVFVNFKYFIRLLIEEVAATFSESE